MRLRSCLESGRVTVYPGDHARTHPDQPAIIMEPSGRTLTFGEYEQRCNRFAHLLRASGLQRGDHIAVLMENNVRYFEILGAAERTGLWYTPLNSYLTPPEVAYIVDDCDAKVLVTSAAKADVAREAVATTPKVKQFFVVDADDGMDPFVPYEKAIASFPASPVEDEQLGSVMTYTSGTTGRPKGIIRPLPDAKPAQNLSLLNFVADKLLGFRKGMTYLSPAPIYHGAPLASVSLALRLGSTSIVMETFDPELYLQLVEKHQVTHSQLVPTMFSRMLKLPDQIRRRYDVSSLETVVHASAPCPVQVKQAMIEWWGPILREYYGATEGNGFTVCTADEWLARPGTVGTAVMGKPHILDDDRRDCPPGTPGLIWFDGAATFEYYKDPVKTAEHKDPAGTMSYVGDVGYLDADGYLYLTDRSTFMIVCGGVNVYPQEAENLLITHPKVMDAAVFGIPNEDMGEEVKAVVQPVEGVEIGPDLERELIEFCRGQLAGIKCPRSIDFESELPRLPTGKLYKNVLRDRYWGTRTSRIV